ncbi:DUF501 domain-containing protein [Fodinicola feengrottensis]|uniref:DUF501 domain-containing protein n=1 Tax=Fodinicola feengrottensis TaxID=435914 RepID=A0ABP4TGE2_9ACTN|nr:DUF501 domain-containing protein [Fodinicola feengrottensis]
MTASVDPISAADLALVGEQIGRPPRGARKVVFRCAAGHPAVVETNPRVAGGTPFPTLYYLTCPHAVSAVSTLESTGIMRTMTERLAVEPEVAAAYQKAHESYLARRYELGDVPEIHGISAGGMPNRVKCLHVLVGHALAAGPGVNPFGDEALAAIADRWPGPACAAQGA